ncbi:amine oxidase catalytic domain-containing protein [Boletus reticuloceps]|uniref:Amine oxidase n=1 Tax=Boletus reticuloceps TaxID=495285 RepID=A0A8I2YCN0_9AGAM|nr:amine oxidase catalytic domain-containing protein [Boletus reticuloceps]
MPSLKPDLVDKDKTASPRSTYRLIAFLSLAAFLLFKSAPFFLSNQPHPPSPDVYHKEDSTGQCVASTPPPASPPAPLNPWSSLTIPEIVQIQDWLFAPEQALNLTQVEVAVPSDNHIFLVEIYYPPKEAVLNYLSSPSTANPPPRFARVTLHHGAAQQPFVRNYLVGPLPIGPHTSMSPLTDIYQVDPIPYNARAWYINDWSSPEIYSNIAAPVAEAFKELFGGQAAGLPNDTLVAGGAGPFSYDGSFRRLWLSWRRSISGPFLHPLNFYQYIDISGTDTSQWKLLKTVYNHQIFDTTESFLEALHNGSLKRSPLPAQEDTDFSWSTRKRVGAQRDLDHLPGPRSVSFAGLRFRVDREQQYVSWMGWGLYLGFDRDMGLSLWDIRFRNERIIYELKPQEALAQYAGNDPFQSSTAWLDRYFGMGDCVRDLLPGYDCPYEAVYLPATTFGLTGLLSRERAICIFEHDSERPLTRHFGYDKDEFGAVKGYQLVIRSIVTAGNYDYLFDYIFHLDGTIEVRVSASGYLQAGYWDPDQRNYGARIWETTMGSLHDHVINYKVDLDIAGTANSLLKTTTRQEAVTHPWFDDDWGSEVIQQTIRREYITNENDALLKLPGNFQGGYSIVNQEERNKWGTIRGYAIHPGYSPIHTTVVGSKRALNNANWARYNLAVSRRKETEPSSSSIWNFNLPAAPPVDFHKFFDGENITQQDLVVWVNVGTHHLPQSEDAPNTRTNIATSSFFITPLNYFDYDVSIDSTNAILLQAPSKEGEPFSVNDYGVRPVHCIPQAPPPFEYAPVHTFDHRGEEVAFESVEAMRGASELYHRIKFGL